MKPSGEELERPAEWLLRLQEEPKRYAGLFDDAKSLAAAAYRLAIARCRTRATWSTVPSAAELHAAACEIQRHVPTVSHVPPAVALADDCDAEGMSVLPYKQAA